MDFYFCDKRKKDSKVTLKNWRVNHVFTSLRKGNVGEEVWVFCFSFSAETESQARGYSTAHFAGLRVWILFAMNSKRIHSRVGTPSQ